MFTSFFQVTKSNVCLSNTMVLKTAKGATSRTCFFYISDKKGNFHFHISDIINIKSSSFPGGLALGDTFLKFIFFIESSRKMIQFKIQFKTKSKIFIQQSPEYSIELFIHKKMIKFIQNSIHAFCISFMYFVLFAYVFCNRLSIR